MPLRSLNSSVLVWPNQAEVDGAVRRWATEVSRSQPYLRRLGYFGSYARGDWGVGSDLDLVAVVATAEEPFERRSAKWDTTSLPVPADVLVYTESEWHALQEAGGRFARRLAEEAVWIISRTPTEAAV